MKNKIKNQNFELTNNGKSVTNYQGMSSEAHQVLLGSLLGDMYLRKECRNPNIEETHSIKQKEYLKWKYKILSNFFDLKLYNLDNPICKAKGRVYDRKTEVRLRSKVSKKLNLYHDLFYKNKIKKISLQLLNQLDTLALAVWYCDDGYYDPENRTVEIHTEGFSIKENQIIKKWFIKKWNLIVNFKKDPSKKKVLLRFPIEESDKFLRLVKEHIFKMHRSMWYKLGHFGEGNIDRLNEAKSKKDFRMKKYRNRAEIKERDRIRNLEYYYKNKEKILNYNKEYNKSPKFKAYIKKYVKRPEVKERLKKYTNEYRKKHSIKKWYLEYQRKYRKRPEVREKIKEYNRKAREKKKQGGKD